MPPRPAGCSAAEWSPARRRRSAGGRLGGGDEIETFVLAHRPEHSTAAAVFRLRTPSPLNNSPQEPRRGVFSFRVDPTNYLGKWRWGGSFRSATNVAAGDRQDRRGDPADQGSVGAQFNLGNKYADGKGVVQDEAEAMRWYRLAAVQGDASAQLALGLSYVKCKDEFKNTLLAYMWFNIAGVNGSEQAREMRDQPHDGTGASVHDLGLSGLRAVMSLFEQR